MINIIFSVVIALKVIDKLYISKKFTKEKNFHLYNDLFSWEMFFFFIGAENVIKILSIFLSANTGILNLLLRFRILILFFPFWNKIIHLEKVMNKITYERHYFAGLIPMVFILLLGFTGLPYFILILVFLVFSLIPFMLLVIFLKNSNSTRKKISEIIIGSIFIGLGCIIRPEILINSPDLTGSMNLLVDFTNIIAPVSLILGTSLIFDSFRKELK
ncbi:hypothetical protein LCGC14_0558970 [marine sediment metagenome]|uniref:Uncharacterized protein n=1 Tax=marine sediment metagenome TaxID=412755 RepID=A0A0F9RMM3_9ZZZZ|nr:MAG: hypothetical protein Lokiarch_02450 [Candidatus Lokiarchaeum sp. GC14_75]